MQTWCLGATAEAEYLVLLPCPLVLRAMIAAPPLIDNLWLRLTPKSMSEAMRWWVSDEDSWGRRSSRSWSFSTKMDAISTKPIRDFKSLSHPCRGGFKQRIKIHKSKKGSKQIKGVGHRAFWPGVKERLTGWSWVEDLQFPSRDSTSCYHWGCWRNIRQIQSLNNCKCWPDSPPFHI